MLRRLYIKNFTLIDKLDMTFKPGFSVITGETGAGKSIILGAISLLLGQRADPKSIKSGCDRCVIEAHFDLQRYGLQPFFDANDIDYDAEDCILRRELTASGKSRAFINDTPVQLTLMRQLGQQLVDIHSQHKNLLLQEEDFQLNVVDIIADDQKLLDDYRQQYKVYSDTIKQLQRLQEDIGKTRENEDFMRFQLQELNDACLETGMQEELEAESETLGHVEDIKSALFQANDIFNNERDGGVVEQLKEASRALIGIREMYQPIRETTERLEECYIELKDIAHEIDNSTEAIDFDPQRLEEINTKLSTIYALQKKHRVESVDELIALRENIKTQLDHIDNSDEELQRLRLLKQSHEDLCIKKAGKLTVARTKAARKIEKEMTQRLVPLGIPHVRFEVRMEEKAFSPDGADHISFYFSANTSTIMQPISEVASGGEIARVMLSLKAMISGAVKLPTIIFDEIDTGVSGKIAEKMALIMEEMGKNDRQVISITHLPQIAARGATHYKVYKEETKQGTISSMQELSSEERIQEIAQMLSGSDISAAAIDNAKALLHGKFI